MLDINVIRQDPEKIRTMLKNRNKDDAILDRLLDADSEWRSLTDENNRLRKLRNEVSMEISKMAKGEEKDSKIKEMREVADKIKANDDRMSELEVIRSDCILNIPNIPHESVPIGKDEHDNVVVYEVGEKRKFTFKPKEHWEIAEDLDIIEFERGVKISGSGFYVMKGDGARLERALINYFLDTHMKQGYTELVVPGIINKAAVIGTGQYPNLKDDMYYLERDDMFLNPTAEVPITNLLQDEILEKEQLPIYYTANLTSYRREVGKHADTKGIIRVHEFRKTEMVNFVLPENSYARLEELRKNAEDLIVGLGLPYRVLLLCTGDMSFSCSKCYDLELYAPGKDAWLECSSCSNFTDFQARRARIKYRPEPHLKSEFVHTLNGSGLALPRTIVAILENYQNEDGSVTIPEVLRPYMGGQEKITKK
ncbi:MAG: serine--tRNA ligase [Candidatus Methanomethylophilaceae archaeon]|uniref:serine--tRNA ligase n=1 Tax=Candidatus Methanarcanum hacksteinii TaxID=2911857 RepID=UPI002A78667F|nr:serine--tRNA ligase [Candidatus Methanomethylophilaceae archaeon]MDY4579895.1 serine--tRNA ligase [Candidatus Methanarcanum hacksteinii]TQS78016.1 MAG: serine--tRNA ligase [Candidatus Methanarcanum hacksteinii]